MRFPNFSELDKEQRAIYSGAPPGESILVMGPPGTGKTVMAFHRASLLNEIAEKQKKPSARPRVMMFSKVLSKYSSDRDGVAKGVESSTMHSWVYGWYRGLARQAPLKMPDDDWLHDWIGMLPTILEKISVTPEKVHWGHLIIDEGQDFPQEMYHALSMVSVAIEPAQGQYRPAITVFADDNQRIFATNCSLQQIQDALALEKERVYRLSKNYRNSRQIAEFARHYYSGLKSGVPDLPQRAGPTLPRVVLASSLEVVRSRIATFAANNPEADIGVLCPRDKERKRVFNSLVSRLKDHDIVVQTYSSREREEHPPEDLVFDRGGSVTVLNFASAKGLEFDAVFIVDPFDGTAGASTELAQMQLYVMASRARDYLELLLMNQPSDLESRLPRKDLYEKVKA